MRLALVLTLALAICLCGGAQAQAQREAGEWFSANLDTGQCVASAATPTGVMVIVRERTGIVYRRQDVLIPRSHFGVMLFSTGHWVVLWEGREACEAYLRDPAAREQIASEGRAAVADYNARQAAPPPAPSRATAPWWTTAENGTRCIESRISPAQRIDEIRRNRRNADVRQYGPTGEREWTPSGAPSEVEVSDGEWEWRYFRTHGACERYVERRRAPNYLR